MTTSSPRWWTALKGAIRYLTGPEASDELSSIRAEKCCQCDARVRYHLIGKGYYWTCGDAFVENMEGPVAERSCGCLVLAEEPCPLSVNGVQIVPAGKTTKERERCPRGKW